MSSELFEKDWKYVVDTIYRINAKAYQGDREYSTSLLNTYPRQQ